MTKLRTLLDISPMESFKTNISEIFWCRPTDTRVIDYKLERAEISFGEENNRKISWFDELLDGSIKKPYCRKKIRRATTILFCGPPGSGKSTFAQQLAYKFMQQNLHVLYVTTESTVEWLQQKAHSYGWDLPPKKMHLPNDKEKGKPEFAHIHVLETNLFGYYLNDENIPQKAKDFFNAVDGLLKTGDAVEGFAKITVSAKQKRAINQILENEMPEVLILDSLNVIEPDKRSEIFQKFFQLTHLGPKIIITILDSSSQSNNKSDYWAYLCDTIIKLDKKIIKNYLIRTIEVVKARYQSHIWGTHQLKIYGNYSFDQMNPTDKKRAHPYRKEGGIFIFPSIHFYLSNYKRKSPEDEIHSDPTKLETLNQILNGGLPQKRCTGFVGIRGGHKSHLGYLHILKKIVVDNERGLIISLRDDEGIAITTLNKILQQEFGGRNINDYIKRDMLEILYYPPGYITPEEFFHKMFISIQRLKTYQNGITLLFNSLDQLGSRFPLCAEEKIFIPGMIETLNAESVTSIFIGVQEPGQPPEQYGLLSMADLILTFKKYQFLKLDYYAHLKETHQKFNEVYRNLKKTNDTNYIETVVINIERFAGGQSPKSGGILELVDDNFENNDKYNNNGLIFTPFSRDFSMGKFEKMGNI